MTDPITLGALIDALKQLNPKLPVYFDWCEMRPGTFSSYRGYYQYLAVGIRSSSEPVNVEVFLQMCEMAVGAVFEGYKGGKYRMDRDTFVWVAEVGSSSGWAIVGVEDKEHWVKLKTALCWEDG